MGSEMCIRDSTKGTLPVARRGTIANQTHHKLAACAQKERSLSHDKSQSPTKRITNSLHAHKRNAPCRTTRHNRQPNASLTHRMRTKGTLLVARCVTIANQTHHKLAACAQKEHSLSQDAPQSPSKCITNSLHAHKRNAPCLSHDASNSPPTSSTSTTFRNAYRRQCWRIDGAEFFC